MSDTPEIWRLRGIDAAWKEIERLRAQVRTIDSAMRHDEQAAKVRVQNLEMEIAKLNGRIRVILDHNDSDGNPAVVDESPLERQRARLPDDLVERLKELPVMRSPFGGVLEHTRVIRDILAWHEGSSGAEP